MRNCGFKRYFRKFLLILADIMLHVKHTDFSLDGKCHSASVSAMPPKQCKKHWQQVQKHPQKVQIFSTNSRLDLSVTLPVFILLGDSHCAVVELDVVVLATFGLEQQQPIFQASSTH